MPTAIAVANDDQVTITAVFETSHNGRDYYLIVKNGVPTTSFVDVPEGAGEAEVVEAYSAGSIV